MSRNEIDYDKVPKFLVWLSIIAIISLTFIPLSLITFVSGRIWFDMSFETGKTILGIFMISLISFSFLRFIINKALWDDDGNVLSQYKKGPME